MELYYWNKTKNRMQTISDFSHPGKFMFKKDFHFEFYSYVDGKKDVNFNVNFLELNYNENITCKNPFSILAPFSRI